MRSCVKNVRAGDVVILRGNPDQYMALYDYIDHPHPDYREYGSGYIEVLNLRTTKLTQLVQTDMARIARILKLPPNVAINPGILPNQ